MDSDSGSEVLPVLLLLLLIMFPLLPVSPSLVLLLAAAVHKGTTAPQLQSDKMVYDKTLTRQSNWTGFVDKKRRELPYLNTIPTQSWGDYYTYVYK